MSGHTKRNKRKKLWLILPLAILLLLCVLWMGLRLAAVGRSQWLSDGLFTDRVFSIEADRVQSIRLQSGLTGESLYLSPEQEPEQFARVVETMNGLSSGFWLPSLVHRGGWTNRVVLYGPGDEESFVFGDGWLLAENLIFLLPSGSLDELTARIP